MQVPDAPDAPSLGQIILYLFYGTGIAIAAVLARLGFVQGRRVGDPGTDHVELAGAVISDHKANEIVAALDKNTAAVVKLSDDLSDTRIEMRELTREIVRNGRS